MGGTRRLTKALVWVFFLLTHSSCIGVGASPKLELLEAGPLGGVQQRSFVVVGSSGEFQQLYELVHAGRRPKKEVPEIDFSTHMVLAAFGGLHSTTGFSIEFGDIAIDGETARVSVVEHRPAAGTIQGTAITSPYAMAILTRLSLSSVTFVDELGREIEKVDL